jgi:hypothetical protein
MDLGRLMCGLTRHQPILAKEMYVMIAPLWRRHGLRASASPALRASYRSGMRKRLRGKLVFRNTYVDGSAAGIDGETEGTTGSHRTAG